MPQPKGSRKEGMAGSRRITRHPIVDLASLGEKAVGPAHNGGTALPVRAEESNLCGL